MICRKCKVETPDDAKFCHICGASQKPTRRKRKRGNGQGSAYKRGNTWTAVVTLPHEPDEEARRAYKGGFPTERDAILYCPTLIKEALAVKAPKQRKLTLQHYYDIWSSAAMMKLSKSKQSAYKAAWKRLAQIKDMNVIDLLVADLQDLVEGLTHYPARDVKSLLSHLYKLAVADNQARLNLSELIVLPELEESEPNPFTTEEIATIWNAYYEDDRIAAYLLLMIYSGMMPGEMFDCTKGKIDLPARQIIGAGKKTKERKRLPIVIAEYLVPVIERILSLTPSGDNQKILFTDKWSFYEMFKIFKNDHKIRDLPLYACRHSTATALSLETDAATSVIQRVMRHGNYKSTTRYIHPETSDMLAAVNAITPPIVNNRVNNDVNNRVNNATERSGARGNITPIHQNKRKPENP